MRPTNQSIYAAVTLDSLSVSELIHNICTKFNFQKEKFNLFVRRTKKGINVLLDDAMIEQLDNEQDILIDVEKRLVALEKGSEQGGQRDSSPKLKEELTLVLEY
jgi:hypothetical protein